MNQKELLDRTNKLFSETIKRMVETANNFYGMTDDEKKHLGFILSKEVGIFINGCEDKESGEY